MSVPADVALIERRAGVVLIGLACLLAAGLLTSHGSTAGPSAGATSTSRFPVDVRNGRAQLESGIDAAKRYFYVHGSYDGFEPSQASVLQPAIQWTGAEPAAFGTVSIDFAQGPTIILSTRAASGTYLCRASGPQEESAGLEDALGATQSTGCAGANP